MLDNCKVSNKNWLKFTAGRTEDSFVSMLQFVSMLCLRPGYINSQ